MKNSASLQSYTPSAADTLKMLALSGRMSWTYLLDRIAQTHATQFEDIPSAWDAIDNRWFEAVLCRDVAGAKVLSVDLGIGHSGTSSRQQFLITYNDAGQRAGLPSQVFAKGSPYLINRIGLGASEALRWEKHFYEHIRPELDIEAPIGYHSNYDIRSGRSIHLIEDLVDTKGATFCDPTTIITRENAEDLIGVMATLHGRFYNSPRLQGEFAYITDWAYKQRLMCTAMNLEKYHYRGLHKASAVLPDVLRHRHKDTWRAIVRATELSIEGPLTLLHCDVHLGNWYKTAAGRMGLLDWQCLSRGHWSHDFAYAISAVLNVEDRRAWERDLLRLYLDRIEELSGHRIPFNEAWLRYRQQIFGALVLWTPTYSPPAFAPKNMQPESTSLELINRFCQAIVDLDSFESLGPL